MRMMYFWGAFFLVIFSSTVAATENYPQLHESRTASDNFEIAKIIDGPIDSLYKNLLTGEYIAQAGSSFWKINAKGQVIDYFRTNSFYSSGLILEDEGFSDWAYTGDKTIKPYGTTLDAKAYSDQQLYSAFSEASIIEFIDKSYEKVGFAYLYNQGQMSVLDISNRREAIDSGRYGSNFSLREDRGSIISSSFNGYQKKSGTFEALTSRLEGSDDKLKSMGFIKLAQHRPTGVAETFISNQLGKILGIGRSSGYGYDVGYSQFQYNYNGELLKFSVFSDKEHGAAQADNFQIIHPPIAGSGDLAFMVVSYRQPYLNALNERSLLPFYEQDIGLHVVRTKIAQNKSGAKPWQLSYSGLHSYDAISGHIHFSQPELNPIYYWFWQSRPLPTQARAELNLFGRDNSIASPALKTFPLSLDFHWIDFERDRKFRLVANNQDAEFYNPEDTEVAITLHFDTSELAQVFGLFNDTSDIISLNLDLQERPFGGELIVSVKDSKKSVTLKKTSFDYQELPYEPHSPRALTGPVPSELFLAYQDARKMTNPRTFLAKVDELKRINRIVDYASPIAYYFAQLSLTLNKNKYFFENTELFRKYFTVHEDLVKNAMDPTIHKNLYVLASQGLYLSTNTPSNDLAGQIAKLFLEQNFDLENEKNRVFIFNAACHYALKQNKLQMLRMVHRAISLGKNPEQFLTDPDFSNYRQDADFLKAIGKSF